jgi:hypothetical protein
VGATVVSNSSGATSTVVASCGTGKIALGGGAIPGGTRTLLSTYPSNSSGAAVSSGQASSWSAQFSGTNGGNTVYVICAAG